MSLVGIEPRSLSDNGIALCAKSVEGEFEPADISLQELIVTFGTSVLIEGFLLVRAGFDVRGGDVVAVCLGGGEGTHGIVLAQAREDALTLIFVSLI